jgi:hypothetical protein
MNAFPHKAQQSHQPGQAQDLLHGLVADIVDDGCARRLRFIVVAKLALLAKGSLASSKRGSQVWMIVATAAARRDVGSARSELRRQAVITERGKTGTAVVNYTV